MTLCVVRDVTERAHRKADARPAGVGTGRHGHSQRTGQDRVGQLANRNRFGLQRQELLGQPIEVLIPQRFRAHHPQYRSGYHANPRVRPMGEEELQLYGLRKDGPEMPIEISPAPKTSNGTLVVSAIRDISSRKRRATDTRLTQGKGKSCSRRYTIGKEQPGGDIQPVFAAVQQPGRRAPETILRQSQDRVRSMALAHRPCTANLAEVDFTAEYATSLSAQLTNQPEHWPGTARHRAQTHLAPA